MRQMIKLRPGDLFLSENPMAMGVAINAVQRIWSVDSKSKYSHAGIIVDVDGLTLESLTTVKYQELFKSYAGTDILIARHRHMSLPKFHKGFEEIRKHVGQWYPIYRIVFMIVPPIAKYIHFGRLLCSELVFKFLNKTGLTGEDWHGRTPDNLHDMVKNSKDWTIIFEDKLGDTNGIT